MEPPHPVVGPVPTRLPLQPLFIDIVKKANEVPKEGGFFGGAKPKSADEKMVADTLQMILREALKLRASDIHLEPQESSLRVRLRVDGLLEEALQIPSSTNLRLVSHVRVMCGLDPERGIGTGHPEDGRMAFIHDGMDADLRLSTFPTAYGDKAVLRMIPRGSKIPNIDELKFPPKTVESLRHIIARPQGMFVVTGPTGSGKSTTLYAILQSLNTPTRNIVTLEDPVEKTIPGITQGMIQPKAGFGFANGLRSILRQDPNVIMLGEIRDLETAEIAVSASLTGHMIFTTLHANSALGVITRLSDMGLEPFLIAASLSAVSAQRLVRRLCSACAQPHRATAAEASGISACLARASLRMPEGLLSGLKQSVGCDACRRTGYSGRALLFEHTVITPALRQLILNKASIEDLRLAAVKDGMETLILDGLRKAAAGETSISEVFRVVDDAD